MMDRRYTSPLQIKAVDVSDEGEFTGIASAWGPPADSHGDIVLRGAYARSLRTRQPAMLFAHDMAQPVGRWLTLTEGASGLEARGALNLDLPKAREVRSMLLHNDVAGLSVGIAIPRDGWARGADGVGVIKEAALHEISIVACPSNARAQITSAKSFGSEAELASILRDAGVPGRAVSKLLRGGWRELVPAEDESPELLDDLMTRVDRATQRLKGL